MNYISPFELNRAWNSVTYSVLLALYIRKRVQRVL